MKNNVRTKIKELMTLHNIPYCIYLNVEGKRTEFGDPCSLEYPDFPKTLFYDSASEMAMYEYLQANVQPRMLSQGKVRSILGTIGKDIFALFMNSEVDIVDFYELAKDIHSSIGRAASNET
jgi:hypothetical protein